MLNTRIFACTGHTLEDEKLDAVCEILRSGGIVAVPTETVYGLAANALDEQAVRRIFEAKGRPQDNPLIVHIADLEALPELAREIPEGALRLAERFWPGPLTIVLKKTGRIPPATSAGLDTVGIRMPSHPVTREIIRRCGFPLAAPSANLSGTPSTTTAQHCVEDLTGRVDAIVQSGDCPVGLESTVLSLAGKKPRLLRPGAVTAEQLEEILGEIELDSAVTGRADPDQKASAPGMKYRHYAPNARVELIRGGSEAFRRYVGQRAGPHAAALCFEGEETGLPVYACPLGTETHPERMAHGLFAALRDLDRRGFTVIYAHCPEPDGVGLAVYNRLLRAASFNVIQI